MKQCTNCQQTFADAVEFCPTCGNAVQPATSTAVPPSAPTPPPLTTPPQYVRNAPPQTRTSGLAIALMICGICCLGVVGIILGIIALKQIKDDRSGLTGSGLAITGIATGAFSLILIPVFASILFPVFAKAREKARITQCVSNQRIIAINMQMYAQDNNGVLPSAATLLTDMHNAGIAGKMLDCPAVDDEENAATATCYGYNAALSGRNLATIPDPSVVLTTADSIPGEAIITSERQIDARHNRIFVASFADGHTKAFPEGTPVTLR